LPTLYKVDSTIVRAIYLEAAVCWAVLLPPFIGGSYVTATLGRYFIEPSLVAILIVLKAIG